MEVAAEDRISHLPDCLLGSIVSLLPIKDAARTMQLSRRWQRIWPSLPLDLDLYARDSVIPSNGQSISRILSSHRAGAPIRRFRASTRVDGTTAAAWLQTLAQRRIDGRLDLIFALDGARPPLSFDLMAAWAWRLRHLGLTRCRLVDPRPRAPLALNHLQSLILADVKISETSLHRVIAGCPALRLLHLSGVHDLRRLAPRSHTLAHLHLANLRAPLEEISFRDTPNVDTIVLANVNLWRLYPNIISQATLPSKLATFHLTLPMLDSPCFAVMPSSSIPMVTVLVLNMKFSDGDEMSKAAGMLSLFPSLQGLRIWCLNFGSKDDMDKLGASSGGSSWQPAEAADTIMYLRQHLKHVKLLGYCGTRGEQQFAKFLMAGAKVLTDMLILHAPKWSYQSISKQRDLICSQGKGSSKAQVNFKKSNNSIEITRRQIDTMGQVRFT